MEFFGRSKEGTLRVTQNGLGMYRVEAYSKGLDQWIPVTHKIVVRRESEIDGENPKYVQSRMPWVPNIHFTLKEAQARIEEIRQEENYRIAATTWTPIEEA